jgi:predicted metal-dependent hydrolase
MPEKIIYIDGVGNVLLKRSNKARYLNLSVKPFAGVSVSVPVGVSYKSAAQFATEKKIWLKRNLEKMEELEKMQTQYDENSGYCTKHHQLILRRCDRENISVRLLNGSINVVHPLELNTKSKEVQEAIRKGIERALKIEAKEHLPAKVTKFAAEFGFLYNKLSLKNIKSRWGSCSAKNNINLSIHLMRLPEHLIDYVILHELVHTVHHNHSTRFWTLLDKVTDGAKRLDKELGNYRIAIY